MHKSPFSCTLHKTKQYHVITLSYCPTPKREKPITVSIAPELGSNMFSLTYGNDEIIVHKKALLEKRGFTGNFVLFPTPNRVKNFTYTWSNKRIVLKKRGKIVEIHGLVYDEPWKYGNPHIENNCATVRTWIDIDKRSPLFEAFPFPCRLTLTYALTPKGVQITYTVKNLGNQKLPFGFALHPYFARLSGNDKTFISVPAKSWMESPKDTLLPTGKLISVAGKPYDIRKPVAVGTLDVDHVYTHLTPGRFATIQYAKQRIMVTLKTSKDFTHVVVYTGDPNAVCIENQTCSTDAHNLHERGLGRASHLLIIPPHQSHTGHVLYKVTSY